MEWLKRKTSVGGKPGDKRARRKKTQFSLWYFVAAFLILSFINTQLLREEITHLPYSEFKTLVAAGRVVTAEIEREHIKRTLKEGDELRDLLKAEEI